MSTLFIATANAHKVEEIRGILGTHATLLSQRDTTVRLEIEETGTRWRVRRKDPQPQSVAFAAPAAMAMAAPASAPAASHGSAAPAAAAAEKPQGEVFKSPMVGTFYRAASPEAEAFCKPGDRASSDTTLCIIEAMKVMNEIKAENGDPVEFGQPLFLIR